MENIMTLPTLTLPKYKLKVSSTGDIISYRPFIVKEEKILLIALEGGQYSQITDAIKHIVSECTFNKIDAENLPVFDLIHIFINIRAKSVGETVEPSMTCKKCKHGNKIEIDLTKIKVKNNKKHNSKISLGGDLGVVMKYPTVKSDKDNPSEISPTEIVATCIDLVYKGEDVYKASEYKSKELVDFIEGLTHDQFEKILEFFDTMPKLTHTVKFKCASCGHENSTILEGLNDFFL